MEYIPKMWQGMAGVSREKKSRAPDMEGYNNKVS